MPIYMDVHIVPGVKASDVAHAHRLDLIHEGEYDCKCMTYWIDETRESIFCLVEAPNKEAVEGMHSKAHGLIPNRIIEVDSSLVQSFLGRIYDPTDAETTEDGLKIFSDSSFRILLVSKTTDPVLLKHMLGAAKAGELLGFQNTVIRKKMQQFEGREIEHGGDGFIISFNAASKALACALAILEAIPPEQGDLAGFKIGINAGEPVETSNMLFGDTLQLAWNICSMAGNLQIALTNAVKELVAKDYLQNKKNIFFTVATQDEKLLKSLFHSLEDNWQKTEFDLEDYCKAMAMSKSQLYRKTISLTGLSPNLLLKDFRLDKAKELMKKKPYNISQITFESGFSSPSYFTKCFKKKYGLLPVAFLDLLQ
ncbi:MAG: nickel-binding protein [Ferruginibacter sp.]